MSETKRIGVLLPSSNMYPSIGVQLVRGIRLGFNLPENRLIELVTEDIGLGASKELVRQKTQKLLLEDVDAIIAFISNPVAESLRTLIHTEQRPFIVVNVGANLPMGEPSPHVFYHTLNCWENVFVAAHKLATEGAKKIVLATSFYDSGYQTGVALDEGLKAGGAEIVWRHITQEAPTEQDMNYFQQALAEIKPDHVIGIHSGPSAVAFIRGYQQLELQKKHPLSVVGLTCEDSLIESMGNAIHGINCFQPWSVHLPHAANKEFIVHYSRKHKQAPMLFALLGYGASSMLNKTLPENDEDWSEKLRELNWSGPQGSVSFEGQSSVSPQYHFVGKYEESKGRLDHLATLDPKGSPMHEQVSTQAHSGWFNPYLCV